MASTEHDVTCPEALRVSTRRKNLKKTYQSKEWELKSDEFLGRRKIIFKGIIRGEGLQVGEPGYLLGECEYWYERKKPCVLHLRVCKVVKDGTLVHHPYAESYKDGSYSNFYFSACMVLCGSCHFAVHHNLQLCPVCGNKYHRLGSDMCRDCFNKLHPEIEAEKARYKYDMKALKKKLMDDEKARVKQWKLDHPKPKASKTSGTQGTQTQSRL
jgi:hypothetical protein